MILTSGGHLAVKQKWEVEQSKVEWREREGRGGKPLEGRGGDQVVEWSGVDCSGVDWIWGAEWKGEEGRAGERIQGEWRGGERNEVDWRGGEERAGELRGGRGVDRRGGEEDSRGFEGNGREGSAVEWSAEE